MTPEQIRLVTASTARLEAAPDGLAGLATDFYDRLFGAHPGLRDMFPADLAAQRAKFAAGLAALVAAVPDFEAFAERSAQLGRLHAAHRVTAQQYAAVGACLLDSLAHADADWDEATHDAWASAYDLVAESMLLAGRRGAPA